MHRLQVRRSRETQAGRYPLGNYRSIALCHVSQNQSLKYRKHKASGQAFVELSGRRHYLGPHGTKASKVEYDRLVAEWLVNGRQPFASAESSLTVSELVNRYRLHVKRHYLKDGRATGEQGAIAQALKPLRQLYGSTAAAEFGLLRLEALREKMIGLDWSRGTINRNVSRIRRLFRWGVRKQLIPALVAESLSCIDGLRHGKCEARETAPILPVDDAIVNATLEYMPDVPADMARLQQLTGMRPAEVCAMRPMNLDRSGDVWTYRPESHKTEHHGRERIIFIGPQAQAILLRYLVRDSRSHG